MGYVFGEIAHKRILLLFRKAPLIHTVSARPLTQTKPGHTRGYTVTELKLLYSGRTLSDTLPPSYCTASIHVGSAAINFPRPCFLSTHTHADRHAQWRSYHPRQRQNRAYFTRAALTVQSRLVLRPAIAGDEGRTFGGPPATSFRQFCLGWGWGVEEPGVIKLMICSAVSRLDY